jgi:hypothetical protein
VPVLRTGRVAPGLNRLAGGKELYPPVLDVTERLGRGQEGLYRLLRRGVLSDSPLWTRLHYELPRGKYRGSRLRAIALTLSREGRRVPGRLDCQPGFILRVIEGRSGLERMLSPGFGRQQTGMRGRGSSVA